jgi:hypothetical protein
MSGQYIRNFFINIKQYNSVNELSLVDTTGYSDHSYAFISSGNSASTNPPLGIFTFYLNSNLPLIPNQVLSAGGKNGRWVRTPELGILKIQSNSQPSSIDFSNLPNYSKWQHASNVIFGSNISNAGASNTITLATPGSLTGDIAFVTCLSYSGPDTCIANGVYSIDTSSPGQVTFSLDGAPGASVFSVVIIRPII